MDTYPIQPEDLIQDETFIAWYKRSDPGSVQYWDQWIHNHPENQAAVQSAVQLLKLLELQEAGPSPAYTLQARDRLMAAIRSPAASQPKVIPFHRRKPFWWASAASIVLIIGMLSLWWINRPVRYETRYGETQSITLPDGSLVTLNANSSLRLGKHWEAKAAREVWLEGEGYFSVKHTSRHTPFTVHTDDVNVEVLGTEFNLKKRQAHTTVVLTSGKVQLSLPQQTDIKPLVMQSGELVQYQAETRQIVRKRVNTQPYSAWKEGKLIFENASLREIAQTLTEQYGVKVDTGDTSLKGKAFNGVFPTHQLPVLLKSLSKAYHLDIQMQGQEIRMRKQSTPPTTDN